ncbi:MAG: hypothetical protein HY015_08325 [Bacteroidetes bacterium]|nr:hypothetical protein [Bacteroidota bacterium]MBI3482962.1 hypothetical protein [Bacteroidota bacterium]
MEKLKDVAIIVILLIVVVALYQVFVTNSNLRAALKTLDGTKKKLDSASIEIKYSKIQVDSLQQNFVRFGAYIHDVQGRLERLDLEKRISDQSFITKRDSIRVRLKELNKTVDLTGQDLPEVPVIETKKP